MNKKDLSERDICTKFINPAVVLAGWNLKTQVRKEVFFIDGNDNSRQFKRNSSF